MKRLVVLLLLSGPLWAAPKTIVGYRKELGLSADQVKKLTALFQEVEGRVRETQSKLQIRQQAFQVAVANREDLASTKAALLELADVRIRMRMEDFKSGRDLQVLLTPQQWQKWKAIQSR